MKVKAVASPEIFSTSNSYVTTDWLVNYNIYNNQNMFWVKQNSINSSLVHKLPHFTKIYPQLFQLSC